MIGNRYLQALFAYEDEDTGLNQLLEWLHSVDREFLDSLKGEPAQIGFCAEEERKFLVKASALIDYCLQLRGIEVPDWLRDDRLTFEKPYYHPKRLSDFDKFRLLYTNPAPFRARNAYFDLEGIKRY